MNTQVTSSANAFSVTPTQVPLEKAEKYHLQTEIVINAPIETTWGILTNFSAYSNWNPFVTELKGELKLGAQLTANLSPPNQKTMIFTPKVTSLEPGRSFSWLGHLFIPGLFDGEHYFRLEPISPTQTRLIHGERFKGILKGIILKMMGNNTVNGFHAMNEALKSKAEAAITGQLE